jgi:hypothetical protein
VILPQPQKMQYGAGRLSLRGLTIRLPSSAEDRFAVNELSAILSRRSGIKPKISSGDAGPSILIHRTASLPELPGADDQTGADGRESYRISVTPAGVAIEAPSTAGVFYAVQTLGQLVEEGPTGAALPEVEVTDWPEFPYRGFMMDTSHGPLPTIEEIERQIDFLSRWKGNQYYFYSEASIEMKGYPLVNPNARYSQEDIRRIVAYARKRHVDVVPCMELFAHLHDLFRVEHYADLTTPRYGGDFNSADPRVLPLIRDWVQQMAALFPSPWFHIGFDEPWSLEAFEAKAARLPPETVYANHLRSVALSVEEQHKRVVMWADVETGARLFTRYPELLRELPAGAVVAPWDYRPKDYTSQLSAIAKTGHEQVVATGIWCWNEIAPDFYKTFANADQFLAGGKKFGARGIINTGWTDDGQVLYRMTLPAIAYGAIASWQSQPVDQKQYFASYALQEYGGAGAKDMAAGLTAMADSEQIYATAFGEALMHKFWLDPFEPSWLQQIRAHSAELRKGRIRAEDAIEHLRAAAISSSSADISTLLLGANMLNYFGEKLLYADTIAGYFDELKLRPSVEMRNLLLRQLTANQLHSLLADMSDDLSLMRDNYRVAWLNEYQPYRLSTAVARWDIEAQYWLKLGDNFNSILSALKPNDPLPPLDSFRPK